MLASLELSSVQRSCQHSCKKTGVSCSISSAVSRRKVYSRHASARRAFPPLRQQKTKLLTSSSSHSVRDARKVSANALMPMAGLLVPLSPAAAKVTGLLIIGGKSAAAQSPVAFIATALVAAVASVLVSKGLNSEETEQQEQEVQQQQDPLQPVS
mmetsp:Transcript_9057/g.16863  ORF Transcript_9057/g.16863 Transcript_9057/m.16863 type:complete len:155 (-) Transcript_9057:902-1366(-)